MTYTLEFENVGDGNALGVYVKDVLDPALDDTVLNLSNMYSLAFSSGVPVSTTTANFPWAYDPATRTLTVLTGNAAPSAGGSFVLTTRLKSGTPSGTVVRNQADVYFPNAVQQVTPTNTILSAVPLPTQLAYTGTTSGIFASTAAFSARLTAGGGGPRQQRISFAIEPSTQTAAAITDSTGTATLPTTLPAVPGDYTLNVSYPGDGLYYLPVSTSVHITVLKKPTILQAPYAVAYATGSARLTLTLTDADGNPLQNQGAEPKTVYLEAVDGSTTTVLATGLLSGTTASFSFAPQAPYRQFTALQARFAGDSLYAAALSTGALQLLDPVPPSVAIQPVQSSTGPFLNGTSLNIGYSVADTLDSSTTVSAYLMQQGPQPPIPVTNGSPIPVSALAPGSWLLEVTATDWAGNQTSTATAAFQVLASTSAPVTTLVAGTPSIGSDPVFIGTGTALSLLASPGQQGPSVAQTYVSIDGSAFAPYAGTIPSLLAGTHILSFYSKDVAGNIEPTETSTVDVDTSAPHTDVLIDGAVVASSAPVITSTDTISFSAQDSESGPALTFYSVDGSTPAIAESPFALSSGTHVLAYYSQDFVGNTESANAVRVVVSQVVDFLPPRTSLVVGLPEFSGASVFVTSATPLSLSAVDDQSVVGDGLGVGVSKTLYAVDGATFSAYSGTFTLVAQGTHTISFYSEDSAGNTEISRSSQVVVDVVPPVTDLLFVGGVQSTGTAGTYASSSTAFALNAVDPPTGNAASGVSLTRYQIDGGAYVVYAGTFTLPAGAHSLAFQSWDNVGNAEPRREAAVLIDTAPPVVSVHVDSPSFTTGDGTLFVTPATPVTFTATDPPLTAGQAGSGTADVEVAIDSGPYTIYGASLTFTEGRHSLVYRAIDRVGNVSAPRTLSVQSDATPPVTGLAPSGSFYSSSGQDYAPAGFAYALVSTDAVVNGVASGVALTRYALDGGAFQAYASTFTLAEGVRTVAFLSADRVGNAELTKSATVFVDATAPVTALTVGAPQSLTGGTLFVSTVTPFALSAQDPVVNGVASGIRSLLYGLDAGPLAPYVSSFTLTAPEGARTLSWRADDNVGNQEVLKSSTVFLDEAPPVTSLAVLGGRQAPGPDAATFYASSDTRFALVSTDAASGLAFTRWQDDGGAFQLYLTTFTLAEGAHALAYQSQDRVENLEVLRSTTALVDATAPISTATVGAPLYAAADGTLFVSTATPVTLDAADPALPGGRPGSGVALLEASLDGGPFVPYAAPLTFAEGRHTLLYKAVDAVGNAEAAHALALSVDATPPVSSLVVGQPQFALSSATVLVSAVTPLAISAQDPVAGGVASGVQASYYRVFDAAPSTAAFSVFAASFTLTPADGPKTVEFYSRDQVLNTEAVKSRTLLLDSTPPAVSLTSPHAGTGICSVVKGKVPVLGSVSDGHLASFELDFAPGQDATTGYALVSSGTADASGTLGVWDASRLAGWQTLRLTAADAVQNVAVTTVTVFVGDPATLMVLGNDALFNMPQGVAADAAGNVFVADTNDDEIQIFTALGSSIAVLGRTSGRDDHDDKVSSTTLVLNKPQGVAPAADGSLWIADTEDDRVVKVSSAGQVLLSLGRLAGKKDEHDRNDQDDAAHTVPGSGPGEFDHPSAVALDAAGNVFVADTENRRVQKLGPDGTPLLAFSLPPLPGHGDDRDEKGDKDDAKAGPLGRPAAVALDAAGRVYAADPDGGRALVFGATGQLLLTIHIPGGTDDKHPIPGQPDGIAVSPDGSCILVADALSDRVFKFDALGNLTLVFGVHGRRDERKDGIRLNKPAGLAFAPDGTLLVADRNNDRVERYGAPNGRPTLVTPPDPDDPEFTVREVVAKDEGGEVVRDDKAGVAFPPGALPGDLKVSVSTMSPSSLADADRMTKVAESEGMKPAYAAVEYGPEGTKFAVAVTLTIPYDPGLVAAEGMSEDSLAVRYWDPAKGDWQTMPSTVDKSNHTVTAKTPHFSLYQVLGSTGTAPVRPLATADPTFTFHDAYAFPNPVRGARAVTLRVQPGLADSVSVRVYDLTGRKVHDSSDFRQDILDDGNGKGFQYTYDHVWDVSGVGSGVYYYVITAVKSGKPDIHKSGRVGVVK
jgi:sugar lactone lactonase YvrE